MLFRSSAVHGQPADGASPSPADGHLSAAVAAEPVSAQQHLRRQSDRSDRVDGQLHRAHAASDTGADSQTVPTPANPASAAGKRQAPFELSAEGPDRFHTDAGKGPVANGAGAAGAEPNQANGSLPDGGKSAAVDLAAPMADKPLASGLASPDKAGTSSQRAFQTVVMDQVVGKAALRTLNGRSEIQIRLKPDFLGSVQMTVSGDREQMMVRILTDQPMVKEIIETHLHHLKAELHNQGLTIDRFEVMVKPDVDQKPQRDSLAQNMNQQSSQHGRRQGREQSPQNPNRGNPDQEMPESPNRGGINYFA